MIETDSGSPSSESTEWRYVSGPGYEGMVVPTEGVQPAIGVTAIEGPPPTDEEIEALEAKIENEINESGIETVDGFEQLTDSLPTFKRYYFAGINVVSDAAKEGTELPDQPEPFHPRLRADLEGRRILMVELSTLVGDNWKTDYDIPGIDGWTNEQFYALYLPESGTFWLEFQLGGEVDNTFH